MSSMYKKMYATLVGRVDTAICELVNTALLGPCDQEHVLKTAEDLRQALAEAEDLYLDAENDTQ